MSAYRKFIGGITRTQLETAKVSSFYFFFLFKENFKTNKFLVWLLSFNAYLYYVLCWIGYR